MKQYLSPDFEPEFQRPGETLEEATIRCFQPNIFFKSPPPLKTIINHFGNMWGFRGSIFSNVICCSRAETPQQKSSDKDSKEGQILDLYNELHYSTKKRNISSSQCGCEWRIYLAMLTST